MAIDMTGAAGAIFPVLGKIAGGINTALGSIGTVAPAGATTWGASGGNINALETVASNVLAQLAANTNIKPQTNTLYSNRDNYRGSAGGWVSYLQGLAAQVLINIVDADVHLTTANKNVPGALAELFTQMLAGAFYFAPPTVTAVPGALVSPLTSGADGVCAATVIGPNGVGRVSPFVENIDLICTQDSQTGATAGRESFTINGDAAALSQLGYDWPKGSGAQGVIGALDASTTGTNLLTNGDFENYAVANTPDGFTPTAGVAGTDFAKDASVFYTGAASLKFIGTSSTVLTSFWQSIRGLVKPQTVYGVNWWMQRSNASATGVFQVDFHNGSAVVQDDAATNNAFARNISTQVTTSWVAYNAFFRTPSILPATLRLRLGLTTTLNNTFNLNVDRMTLWPATDLYQSLGGGQGGPFANVYSGATPFMKGDKFPIAVANNRTVVSWDMVFEQLFGVRALGMQAPQSGSTAIATALIN